MQTKRKHFQNPVKFEEKRKQSKQKQTSGYRSKKEW